MPKKNLERTAWTTVSGHVMEAALKMIELLQSDGRKKRGVLTGSKKLSLSSRKQSDDIKNVASKLVTNGSAREWRMGMINELYIYRGDMMKKVYNSTAKDSGIEMMQQHWS
ncbi:Uncharacterized protein Fot_29972 [Forsythia ovata]|uniref:Uncharacterized protein n=1 Tax=Forsythia ovata TaxID=205694 RepID=A0ABD1TTE9_9LAMI